MEIIISTQKELDDLPSKFDKHTTIIIKNDPNCGRLILRVARENSTVKAYGNSTVEAYDNSGVHLMSITANVILFAFAVCWVLSKGKVKKKNKTATIIYPTSVTDSNSWIINQGLKKDHGNVVVFKRVSFDFKTQENTHNETIWEVNKILTHPSWDPSNGECGEGKFHACSRPYFCDEFRSGKTDKYIALKVNVKDMFAWPNAQYPYKIAFRKCKVLYVCDKFGKKI